MPIIKTEMAAEADCTSGAAPTDIPESGFGACRFCETQGEHKNMMSEQVLREDREDYFSMLLECFNVFLATDGSCLICASCARRLRDARDFRRLVLRAQVGLFAEDAASLPGGTEVKIKPEPSDPPEPSDDPPEPPDDPAGAAVSVKTETDIDIVEHEFTDEPEPKKQRLDYITPSKMDSILAGLLSRSQEPMEQETHCDQNPYLGSSEIAEKFREEYYKSIQHEEEEENIENFYEMPEKDLIDLDQESLFLDAGCGCKLSCLDKFDRNDVLKSRLDCLEQDYYCYHHINHLNLMMLGAISATAKIIKEKTYRAHVVFWFRGTPVCKKFFLFVHALSNTKYEKILRCFRVSGVESLTHGNKKALMTKQQRTDVVTFINNFSEQNSLVLPGRSLTNTDLHILPSSMSRTSIYERYVRACKRNNTYPLSRPLWYKCWDNFCPNVTESLPSNPCMTCENFANDLTQPQTENDKKKRLKDALDHLNNLQVQRSYYQNVIAQVGSVTNMSLGKHEPCSFEGQMHYSFDYLQQIHLPHNPDQTGPQDFLNGYKVSLFGVAIEPLNKFVLYVIPECVPKGINLVISLLHHFFETFALGETHVVCHASNQNKNNTLIQYAVWRVRSGLHKSFQLSFLPSGHDNFAPDVYFGLFKSKFRECNAYSLKHICEIAANVSSASITGIVVASETGESHINNYDWRELFKAYNAPPVPELLTYQHFNTDSQVPWSVMCSKSSPNEFSTQVTLFDLSFRSKMPNIIEPQLLSFERQKYLYDSIRKYVLREFQDILCPLPNGLKEHQENCTDNSNQSGCSKVEGDREDPIILMDVKDEQDGSDDETFLRGDNRKASACSYCGGIGHRNEIRQGVYVCAKRQLDSGADSKIVKKCEYCIPKDVYSSVLDSKLIEVYMENCEHSVKPNVNDDDPLDLLDPKEEVVEISTQDSATKKRPVCSYCGIPGHRNIIKHGIYFCKKRQEDYEAANK